MTRPLKIVIQVKKRTEIFLDSNECQSLTQNSEPETSYPWQKPEPDMMAFQSGDFEPSEIHWQLQPNKRAEAFYKLEVQREFHKNPCSMKDLAKRLRRVWRKKAYKSPPNPLGTKLDDCKSTVDKDVTKRLPLRHSQTS